MSRLSRFAVPAVSFALLLAAAPGCQMAADAEQSANALEPADAVGVAIEDKVDQMQQGATYSEASADEKSAGFKALDAVVTESEWKKLLAAAGVSADKAGARVEYAKHLQGDGADLAVSRTYTWMSKESDGAHVHKAGANLLRDKAGEIFVYAELDDSSNANPQGNVRSFYLFNTQNAGLLKDGQAAHKITANIPATASGTSPELSEAAVVASTPSPGFVCGMCTKTVATSRLFGYNVPFTKMPIGVAAGTALMYFAGPTATQWCKTVLQSIPKVGPIIPCGKILTAAAASLIANYSVPDTTQGDNTKEPSTATYEERVDYCNTLLPWPICDFPIPASCNLKSRQAATDSQSRCDTMVQCAIARADQGLDCVRDRAWCARKLNLPEAHQDVDTCEKAVRVACDEKKRGEVVTEGAVKRFCSDIIQNR